MQAKDFLKGIRAVDRKLENLRRQREILRCKMTNTAPVMTDGMSKGGNDIQDRKAELCCQYVDCEAEIETLRAEYVEKMRRMLRTLQKVEDELQQDVLSRRYVEYMRFEDIAEDMHLSERQVLRIHKKALKTVQSVLQEQKRGNVL